ncbi:type III-A CRISPR-associated protein Cas10/Csm1, partial [Thermovibrio ammonificans]
MDGGKKEQQLLSIYALLKAPLEALGKLLEAETAEAQEFRENLEEFLKKCGLNRNHNELKKFKNRVEEVIKALKLESKPNKVKPAQTVFSQIRLEDSSSKEESQNGVKLYKLEKLFTNKKGELKLLDEITHSGNKVEDAEVDEYLNRLLRGAAEDLKKASSDLQELKGQLPKDNEELLFNIAFETLKRLIVEWFWCLSDGNPKISIADKAITLAAAVTAAEASNGNRLLLTSVDFSGIQSFIFQQYRETKKGAAKILRARSFFISLALEAVVKEILEAFGVNRSCILLNGGGKALLLLPVKGKVEEAKDKLLNIRNEIKSKLIETFYGEIKIKIAAIDITLNELSEEHFKQTVRRLSKEENRERFKLFDLDDFDSLNEKLNRVYEEQLLQGLNDSTVCKVCGKRRGSETLDDGETTVCKLCKTLIEKGKELPKAAGILVKLSGSKFQPLPELYFIKEKKGGWEITGKPDRADLLFFFTPEVYLPLKPAENHIPTCAEREEIEEKLEELITESCEDEACSKSKNEIKSLCQIAHSALELEDNKAVGKPFLAVIKADVDRLGLIFSTGFGENYSLPQMAGLSRMLELFFSHKVKELVKEKYPNIYSVFSGGDDLFLLAPWRQGIEFTKTFLEAFQKFTQNPQLTVSVGIAVQNYNLPIYTLAEQGESALEKAKEERNSVTLFNVRLPLKGNGEKNLFEEILNIAEEILGWIKEGKLSIATIYKLLAISELANSIHKNFESKREKELLKSLMWRPYLRYTITRNIEDKEVAEEIFNKFESWIKEYSETTETENKENMLYPAFAIAIYRRRRY